MPAMLLGPTRGGNHRQRGRRRAHEHPASRRRLPVLVAVVALVPVAGSVSRVAPHRSVSAARSASSVAPTSPALTTPQALPSARSTSGPHATTGSSRSAPNARTSVASKHETPATGKPGDGPLLTGPGVRPGERPPIADPAMISPASAGARATAVYFVRAVDWSIATNDPYLIRKLGLASCRACAGYIAQLTALRRAGATLHGGRWTINGASVVEGKSSIRSDYVFRVVVDKAAATVTAAGAEPSKIPARSDVDTYVFVSWLDGRWRVVEQTT